MDKKVKHPSEIVTVDQELEVVVLELDVEGRKLSLGHKQIKDNPWDKYESEFSEGTVVKSTIHEIVDKGATVVLNENITAFVPNRHLEKEDGNKLKKGEDASFKVIEFNKDYKKVVLSHSAVFKDIEQEIVNKSKKTTKKEISTLGDIDALVDLKNKMKEKK